MRLTLLLGIVLTACRPPAGADAAGTSADVMVEVVPGTPLEDMLEMLDQHLVNAMAGQLEGHAVMEFRRAEAISDRLLEARMPFEWITSEQYSLQARLRQVQSTADRVLAELQTGFPRDQMLRDLRDLRTDVARLRQAVAAGGGRAPPPIEDLLKSDTSAARPRPAASREPGPLGTPIPPDGTPD